MNDNKRKKASVVNRCKTSPGVNGPSRPQSKLSSSNEHLSKGSGSHKAQGSLKSGTPAHKTPSYDRVRKIVQEEGRTARNLIAWNVPVESGEKTGSSNDSAAEKGTTSNESSQERPKKTSRVRSTSGSQSTSKGRKSSNRTDSPVSSKTAVQSKKDLRARYWAFLFDNLKRAVDEVYSTCEQDESVLECKEVIMILEQCTNDFKSLIDKLEIIKAYEKADEDSRPTSLAWEVRKISPAKHPVHSPTAGLLMHKETPLVPTTHVARSINFAAALSQPTKRGAGSGPQVTKPTTNSTVTQPKTASPRLARAPKATVTTQPTKQVAVAPAKSQQTPVNGTWADKVKRVKTPREVTNGDDQSLEPVTPQTPEGEGFKSTESTPVSTQNSITAESSPGIEEEGEGWEIVHKAKHGKLRRNASGSMSKLSTSSTDSKSSRGRPPTSTKQKPGSVAKSKPNTPRSIAPTTPRAVKSTNGLVEKAAMKGDSPRGTRKSAAATLETQKAVGPKAVQPGLDKKTVLPWKVNARKPLLQDLDREEAVEACKTEEAKPEEFVKAASESTTLPVRAETPESSQEIWHDSPRKYASEPALAGILSRSRSAEEMERLVDQEENKDEEEEKALETVLSSLLDEEQHLDQELERANADADEGDLEEDSDLMSSGGSSLQQSQTAQTLDWDTMIQMFEAERNKNWSELAEEEDQEVVSRTPGRVVHMHEKLSSPSRKRPLHPSRQKYEEKQTKARELREKLMQDKAERVKALTKKVEEVRQAKDHVLQQKKDLMQRKLQKAEEKRIIILEQKVKRAHEEKTKAGEIAFIMNIEAHNKKLDIIAKHQESEARLQDLQEERQRKHEEKAAKEAAAEERRRTLQAERQARLLEMQSRWQEREAAAEQQKAELASQKSEARRVKEKEHEDRVAALQAQHQAHIEELSKKIKQKEDEADRRHQENLQLIREKAFEMSILRHSGEEHTEAPEPGLYETKKFCTTCKVMILSEVYLSSHLHGKKHKTAMKEANAGRDLTKHEIEKFNLENIHDAPLDHLDPKVTHEKERQTALKKRCKKLRLRMMQRGSEYENQVANKQLPHVESEHRAKLQKVSKDLSKLLNNQDRGPWAQTKLSTLDRAAGEITRAMEKRMSSDQLVFRNNGGLVSLLKLLSFVNDTGKDATVIIPSKSFILVANALRVSCSENSEVCQYLLFSNKISTIIDVLSHQLQLVIPANLSSVMAQSSDASLPQCPLSNALLNLLSTLLTCLTHGVGGDTGKSGSTSNATAFTSRISDVISYITSVGVVDKLSLFFHNVSGPLQEKSLVVEFVNHSLRLLNSLLRLLRPRLTESSDLDLPQKLNKEDCTHLLSTLRDTDMCGLVPLLYGLLLHRGAASRGPHASSGEAIPTPLPSHIKTILLTAFKLLNSLAVLDLALLQASLGGEGMSLELRHISSFLLWHCASTGTGSADLMHEVILLVGHFTLRNTDNQLVMQSGQPPTVLQQLCQLPFEYFSDPRLTTVLYPSLISCCYQSPENTACLRLELSPDLLIKFLQEKLESADNSKDNKSKVKPKSTLQGQKGWDSRFLLEARVPKTEWSKILEYFTA